MAFSFTFGGQRLEDFGLNVANVVRPVLPPVTPRTVPIPSRVGDVFFRADIGMTEIEVDVFVIGDNGSLEDAQDKVRAIADVLDPQEGLKELIFDDEPDKKYDAVLSGNTNLNQVLELKRGTITFLVPDGFAQNVNAETLAFPVMDFTRGSNLAFRLQGSNDNAEKIVETIVAHDGTNVDIIDNFPRYFGDFENLGEPKKFGQSVLIEQGTTNLLTVDQAGFQSTTGLNALIGATITSIDPDSEGLGFEALHSSFALEVVTNGDTDDEGFETDNVTLSPSTTYTLSVFLRDDGTGGQLDLNVDLRDDSDAFIQNLNSTAFVVNDDRWTRHEFTFTTTSDTDSAEVGVRTAEPIAMTFYVDSMQLEQNDFMTSWIFGGGTRVDETMPVLQEGLDFIDGTSGTMQFLITPHTQPQDFGTIVEWGQFIGDNSLDRLSLQHGTSIGTDRQSFLFTLTNGDDTQTASITATLSNQAVQNQFYYVAIRWNLTGDVNTGFFNVDVHDFTNNETVSNDSSTSLNPLGFENFPEIFTGTTTGGGNYVNMIYDEIRFDTTVLTDTEISDNITDLRNDVNTFIADREGATHWNFDRSMSASLYLSKGNTDQVGIMTFDTTDTRSSFDDILEIVFFNVDSQEKIHFLNQNEGGITEKLIINFENRTLRKVEGGTESVIMNELSIDSTFFTLPQKTELTFQVRHSDEQDMDRFKYLSGLPNTFVYFPRFI